MWLRRDEFLRLLLLYPCLWARQGCGESKAAESLFSCIWFWFITCKDFNKLIHTLCSFFLNLLIKSFSSIFIENDQDMFDKNLIKSSLHVVHFVFYVFWVNYLRSINLNSCLHEGQLNYSWFIFIDGNLCVMLWYAFVSVCLVHFVVQFVFLQLIFVQGILWGYIFFNRFILWSG